MTALVVIIYFKFMKSSRALAAIAALCLFSRFSPADEKAVNPQITKIIHDVSEDRIKAIIEKLVSFGTRNTLSDATDPVHGVGAARQWILEQMRSYNPKLQVRFDQYHVKKQGQRIFKDVDLYNVVAVLPGKTMPETQVWITGHYDSLNLGAPRTPPAGGTTNVNGTGGGDAAGDGAGSNPLSATQNMTPADFEKNAALPAPGACDDGSGTAAVMELARVMSQYEFDKTLVFVAFAGEEQGLIGSSLEAVKAHKENTVIEAVLNNDIIGTDTSGNGRFGNTSVSVYSDETADSPSQQLSRYAREISERYMPSMKVNTVFMGDRLGRGGDHTPFQWEGYAAVRFSTPNEIYANQHHATDLLENMSIPFTAKVARVNAVVAASLALSPKPPVVMRAAAAGGAAGRGAGAGAGPTADAAAAAPKPDAAATPATPPVRRPPTPMISRGQSGYDALLQWKPVGPDAGIKGYTVVIRATTAPQWEQEIYVGKVTQYLIKDVSIDDLKFGIKAIGTDGGESLVSPYLYPPRVKTEIETIQ
jgi:Peptidase family M28